MFPCPPHQKPCWIHTVYHTMKNTVFLLGYKTFDFRCWILELYSWILLICSILIVLHGALCAKSCMRLMCTALCSRLILIWYNFWFRLSISYSLHFCIGSCRFTKLVGDNGVNFKPFIISMALTYKHNTKGTSLSLSDVASYCHYSTSCTSWNYKTAISATARSISIN